MTLADACLGLIVVGMTAYLVLGGGDFGAGLWDLTAGSAARGHRLRAMVQRSMGPVWEANHVWLIFVLVVAWTAFPVAFGSVMSTLYVPLFIAAAGIILRGTGYALRGEATSPAEARVLGGAFALASVLTPFCLGAAVGGIGSGRVPVGDAAGSALDSWLNPTSIALGVLAVLAGAYLAAVYMAADAQRDGLVDLERMSGYRDRRRRPELRLLLDPATDDIEAGSLGGKDAMHWVRLRVANRWGKDTAEDVEVLVVKVAPWTARSSLHGFRLIWSNTVETDDRWSGVQWPTRQTIPPGTARHVDLLYVAHSDPEPGDSIEGGERAIIGLQVLPVRRDGRNVLSEGEWSVLLTITARNADAVYYGVTINFDGLWWPIEEMRQRLEISVRRAHHVALKREFARGRSLRIRRASRADRWLR